ncbi:MAG: hypothetical protein AAFS10_06320 [Myxococcota bacterium]
MNITPTSAASGDGRSMACLPAIIGCVGAVVALMLVAGGAVALLFLRGGDDALPAVVETQEKIEVVTYAKVTDRKRGPSTTRPSGKRPRDDPAASGCYPILLQRGRSSRHDPFRIQSRAL